MATYDRTQLDLLLLGAVAQEASTGYEAASTVRTRTRGAVTVSPQTAFQALHRLTRNRLMRRLPDQRYELTSTGERVLAARHRRWRRVDTAVKEMRDGVA